MKIPHIIFPMVVCALGLFVSCVARAQDTAVPPPSAPAQRSAVELEQLVQPIAAYPDILVGVMLPASVYPIEVGDAAFQLGQTNGAVDINAQSWDPSIKSLALFPSVVQWMDRNLPWTVELGRAFVAGQKEVLDAIQRVRSKAYAAGTLKSDASRTVTRSATAAGKEIITIVPVTAGSTGAAPAAAPPAPVASTAAVSGAPAPVGTTPPLAYTPPPAYEAPAASSDAKSAAGLVVGITAVAVLANNVDWDEKYVVNTPGGAVVVDEDDLEDLQNQRQSNQPQSASASSAAPASQSGSKPKTSTQSAGKGAASTQSARPTAATPQSGKKAWQPDASRMASSGAPQASTASQSPAARGWSQPTPKSASPSVGSSRGAGDSRSGELGDMSEGSRARDNSGRGAASRSGGRSKGKAGRPE